MRAACWGVAGLLLSASMMPGQGSPVAKDAAAAPGGEPLVVDAHSSPYRATIYYRFNIANQRFDMRDATMLDMLSFAFKRENDAILGGPTWIDFDHFDITAKVAALKPTSSAPAAADASAAAPPVSPYDQIRPVLLRVLEERFHLKYHTEEKALPGYVVTVAKEGSKLVEAKDATAPSECHGSQDKAIPGQYTLICTSETMAQFVSTYGGVFPHPAVDRTGLTKVYDFTFKLSFGQMRTRDDYVRAYVDVFNKQLGLVVTAEDVPQPAIVVDSVDRMPTANAPDIAKLIPPRPEREFDVASIKPAAESEPQQQIRATGSQITLTSMSLQDLLVRAWQLPTGAWIANQPTWLGHDRFTLLVKLPAEVSAQAYYQDQDQFANMLQKLIIDRFKIKAHWGEQTGDSWVLLPGTPKMKKADPATRTTCGFGPAVGEKALAADSPYDRQFHCQNVTMAQFAEMVQPLAGSDVKNRVPDKTGLAGAYDFTVVYSSFRKLRADAAAAAAAKPADDAAAAPAAGEGIQDAFHRQLGIRLEKQPLTTPALVLDHIEQAPTEN